MPSVPLRLHQREQVELKVTPRAERGKGPVGRLRRDAALLPGVMYGHGQDPQCFKVGQISLEKILAGGGRNAVFMVEIEGDDAQRAVVREVQYHKVSGNVEHIDFLRIDPTEKLRVNVPLVVVGIPSGVRVAGGAMQQTLSEIEMECIASELPGRVEIDVTELEIGDSVHVSDILEQEQRIVTDGERTIVNVLAPRLTVEEEEEAEPILDAEAEEEADADADAQEDADAGEAPAAGSE